MVFEIKKNKKLIKNHNGGAVVEFAIILPLFISLIFGIIEFGLLLYNEQVITNASREGARAGIIVADDRVTDQEIKDIVKDYARSFLVTFGSNTLDDDDINISPSYSTRNKAEVFGTDLVVDVVYEYSFLVLSAFGLNPITLQAQTVMKME